MPRALYHRAKKVIVRRQLRKRAAEKRQRETSPSDSQDGDDLQSPPQRPRYGEANTTDDNVAEFTGFRLSDVANDQWIDSDGGAGDYWEPDAAATVSLDQPDLCWYLLMH